MQGHSMVPQFDKSHYREIIMALEKDLQKQILETGISKAPLPGA